MLGTNPKERAKVYMMGNIVMELKGLTVGPQYATGSKEDVQAKLPEKLPPILKFQGKNKYLCTSDKPTWVDFFFFELIQNLRWVTEGQIFTEYPALRYYYDEMC